MLLPAKEINNFRQMLAVIWVTIMKLEICCFSVGCALTAEQAGADRIELCASRSEGGLTPSYGTLLLARERVTIPYILSFVRAVAIFATAR